MIIFGTAVEVVLVNPVHNFHNSCRLKLNTPTQAPILVLEAAEHLNAAHAYFTSLYNSVGEEWDRARSCTHAEEMCEAGAEWVAKTTVHHHALREAVEIIAGKEACKLMAHHLCPAGEYCSKAAGQCKGCADDTRSTVSLFAATVKKRCGYCIWIPTIGVQCTNCELHGWDTANCKAQRCAVHKPWVEANCSV